MARLTLNGMYEYEPSIFDGMILPEDYDKQTLLFEILQRSGQLYPYHQQPLILKEGIRLWFARNYLNFDRTMAALTMEYNPIENYNRYENNRRTPDLTDEERNTGSDTLATSGSDTTASSGTDTSTLSGQDVNTLSGQDVDTLSGQDVDTLSGQDVDTLSGDDSVERTHTNYDEETTRSYTGYNEKNVKTGTDTTERSVSAFDGSGYQPAEKTVETFGSVQDSKDITGSYKDDKKITGSYKDTTDYGKVDTMDYGKVDTMSYGKSDTTTYGKTDTQTFGKISTDRHTGKEDFESHIHGNIGVTTSQQMIESELELRKFDIYADIARRFENEFIVQVY